MSQSKRKKRFDCIAFKRQAQAAIYKDIKNLSPEEEVAYFRRQAETGPLGKWWKTVKRLPERSAAPATTARRSPGARARKAS